MITWIRLNPIIVILLSEFVVEIVMFSVILVMLSEEKPAIWMFPNAEVAPAVTWETIAERLSDEYPVISMLPSAAVAPAVTFSIIPVRSPES